MSVKGWLYRWHVRLWMWANKHFRPRILLKPRSIGWTTIIGSNLFLLGEAGCDIKAGDAVYLGDDGVFYKAPRVEIKYGVLTENLHTQRPNTMGALRGIEDEHTTDND